MPAQQDDGCHEGKEGEAGNTGQANNEPDGDTAHLAQVVRPVAIEALSFEMLFSAGSSADCPAWIRRVNWTGL